MLLPRPSENTRPFTHTAPGILTGVRDGRRVVAVDLTTWASACVEIYRCNPARAPLAMDAIGQRLGSELAAQERRDHPLSEDHLLDIMSYLSEMGWGQYVYSQSDLKDFGERKAERFHLKVNECAFAQLNLGGESPICHFSVGVVKGALGLIQGTPLQGWEEGCSSRGGASCEIVVAMR